MSSLSLGIITFIVFILLGIGMFLVSKYCKKKSLKIGLAIIIAIFTLYAIIFSIDYNRVTSLEKPIFVYEILLNKNRLIDIDNPDIKKTSYQGLGYKVEIEVNGNNEIIKAEMYIFGKLVVASIT